MFRSPPSWIVPAIVLPLADTGASCHAIEYAGVGTRIRYAVIWRPGGLDQDDRRAEPRLRSLVWRKADQHGQTTMLDTIGIHESGRWRIFGWHDMVDRVQRSACRVEPLCREWGRGVQRAIGLPPITRMNANPG